MKDHAVLCLLGQVLNRVTLSHRLRVAMGRQNHAHRDASVPFKFHGVQGMLLPRTFICMHTGLGAGP